MRSSVKLKFSRGTRHFFPHVHLLAVVRCWVRSSIRKERCIEMERKDLRAETTIKNEIQDLF